MAIIVYFNVTLLKQANTLRAKEQARSSAIEVVRKILSLVPQGPSSRGVLGLALRGYKELASVADGSSGVRYIEVFDQQGKMLFRYGKHGVPFPEVRKYVEQVVKSKEIVSILWGSDDGKTGREVSDVSTWSSERVTYELFAPVFWGTGKDVHPPLNGVVHVSVELAYAPVKMQLIFFGNLILSALFLVTSLLALNLWGEHAINRPLRGLLAAQNRLESDLVYQHKSEFYSGNELINLYKSFQTMALDLVKYQRELEAKTVSLEEANRKYKALNERLEQEVERKTKEMKEFFSLVTHDLRIPLAAIQGYTRLLGKHKDDLTERQQKFLQRISIANTHALELVRNLLEAMKYEFGSPPQVVMEEVAVKELIEDLVSNLPSPEQETRLIIEIDTELYVVGDRLKLGRVLNNLVVNALRHSEKEVRVEIRQQGEGVVEFAVVDQGAGIPEEHIPLLFEKFKHFPSESGPSSGMGLGLYIVRKILEGHGSSIAVSSRVGEGSRFCFALQGGRRGENIRQERKAPS